MKSVVIYESHWGNTAAVARAIASGLGPEASALPTDEATPDALADVRLIVAGAPVFAFRLPTEESLARLGEQQADGPAPDLSRPALRSWLEDLPAGRGRSAAFETAVRWSPGGARGSIERGLRVAGYAPLARGRRFVVQGTHGPLRNGELEAAHDWGVELRRLAEGTASQAA
jgi:hypothetical protein